MNDFWGFAAVPAISVICLFLGQTYKQFKKLDKKFIPALCGAFGMVLGLVCYLTIPGFIPAENWLVALVTGLVSGWAATGLHQAYKQFTKTD